MDLKFRALTADEIEVRVSMAKRNGVSLLLYKNSRCDQNILDETVGPLNWQRHHTRNNANCIVSIWDDEKKQWIEKEDTGVESNTEKEKGLASDSFKRACFNWGIGRELYTAPFIWINAEACKALEPDRERYRCRDTFSVEDVTIEGRKITGLVIRNDTTGQRCFSWKLNTPQAETKATPRTPKEAADMVLRIGKHQGETLRQVYNTDKPYLNELMAGKNTPAEIRTAISIMTGAVKNDSQ